MNRHNLLYSRMCKCFFSMAEILLVAKKGVRPPLRRSDTMRAKLIMRVFVVVLSFLVVLTPLLPAQPPAGTFIKSSAQKSFELGAYKIQFADFVGAEKAILRSEERRVGKECRSRWSPY